MDNETRNMTRMAIYVAAGGYLIYLAYKLFSTIQQSEGLSHVLGLVAMAVFALGGVGMIVFGLRQLFLMAKNGASEFEKQQDGQEKDLPEDGDEKKSEK